MSVKYIAIRVDASSQIGTGHFMRCLTLADGLKQRGAKTRFISRHLPEYLRSMLTVKGHEFMLFNSAKNEEPQDELAHSRWLGTGQSQDAADSIQALSDEDWDWLIVDHYALDYRWESMLRQSSKKILVIDDIADRQHDCDILLDQNYYADMDNRYSGKVPVHCQLLLGPRYALLRDEFRLLHEQAKPRSGPVKRILVFLGGIDTDNYTGHAIEALSKTDVSGLRVDVVIGAQHPCREQITAACVRHGFICHVQTDKMAELMAAADLAIGAGGVACWERCCLGLPTLVFCTADNQYAQVADAARQGLLYAPGIEGDLTRAISRHTYALIENAYIREFISRNGMQAVNGQGVSHAIASMAFSGIEIRKARPDDSENLFQWRNHPTIREVSRNASMIDWQDHQKWFAAVLVDTEKILLIGLSHGFPVGVVRFDVKNDEAEISIYLAPEKISSGLGRDLLQSSEKWLAANHPSIRQIHAHVLGANERSQRLFAGAGFQVESTHYSKKLN